MIPIRIVVDGSDLAYPDWQSGHARAVGLERSCFVWLAYTDESYSARTYCIASVLVPDTEARSLTRALDDVVARAAATYPGITPRTELHGYELVGGTGAWASLANLVRARIAVYTKALEAIVAHDVRIVLRSVHTPRLAERYATAYHPHSVVLTHLIERIDREAEAAGEWALMIADEVSNQREHRRDLWHYQRGSTWGYKSRQITRLVDTIHFAPSFESRLVQAADLVAYEYRRAIDHTETDERSRKAHAALYRLIQSKTVHSWCWIP